MTWLTDFMKHLRRISTNFYWNFPSKALQNPFNEVKITFTPKEDKVKMLVSRASLLAILAEVASSVLSGQWFKKTLDVNLRSLHKSAHLSHRKENEWKGNGQRNCLHLCKRIVITLWITRKKKNLKTSILQVNKWVKEMNIEWSKDKESMACNHVKKCLASLAIKEMKTTATLGFLLARDRIVFTEKQIRINTCEKVWEKNLS